MKRLTEPQALITALVTSCAALIVTLGVALILGAVQLSSGTEIASPSMIASRETTAEAAQGRHLFLLNCAHCHGDDAHGDEGPDLFDLHKSDARIHQVITSGIKGEMPSFAKKLNDSDIRGLTTYLRTLRS